VAMDGKEVVWVYLPFLPIGPWPLPLPSLCTLWRWRYVANIVLALTVYPCSQYDSVAIVTSLNVSISEHYQIESRMVCVTNAVLGSCLAIVGACGRFAND
jgi:hypothetical protein